MFAWLIDEVYSQNESLKSPASRLFAQPFVHAQIKENTKVPCHWSLWEDSTGDRWISLTKGQ